MIPQIIWIVLSVIGLGIAIAKHGEQREDKYSAWGGFIFTDYRSNPIDFRWIF